MALTLSESVLVEGTCRPLFGDRGEHVASLRPMLQCLEPNDRVLIELVGSGHRSLREVARMLDQSPGQLSRRFKSVWRRLHDPFIRHLFDGRCPLPPEYRQIGVEKFLAGLPAGAIADKHRMTEPDVWQILSFLKGYARGKGLASTARGRK